MRRLNQSTPTVIQTELHPLDESFWIEPYRDETNPEQPNPDLGLDQWYYDNTNTYKPDRTINPLVLVAKLTATDGDTKISYNPNLITGTKWYVSEWDYATNAYVEREITAQRVPGQAISEPYYLDGFDLVVRRNVLYSHSVLVRCVGVYQDPRDVGITHVVLSEARSLSTHRDATPVYPDIDVLTPSTMSFNPLLDENSRFSLKAWADWSVIAPNVVVPYRAQAGGTEQMLPSNPDIPSVSPIMDIAYGDTLLQDQEFGLRKTANGLVDEVPANTAVVSRIKGNTIVEDNSLVSVKAETIKTTGFNLWDEEYIKDVDYGSDGTIETSPGYISSKNKLSVIPASTIYFKSPSQPQYVYEFDVNGTFIQRQEGSSGSQYTLTANTCFIHFSISSYFALGNSTYNNDICINISDPSKNGTYEPYWSANRNLDWISKIGIKKFNLWDEVWELGAFDTSGNPTSDSSYIRPKSFIPVAPSSSIFFRAADYKDDTLFFYDASKNFISYTTSAITNTVVSLPANCYYITFCRHESSYNHDICINESVEGMNGIYVPYGETAPYFGDGLKSAGTVHDEIKVEDGVVKAVKRVGSVDLGSLEWITLGQEEGSFRAVITNMSQTGNTIVAICSKYSASVEPNGYNIYYATEDKVFVTNAGYGGGPGLFAFRDTAFANYTTSQVAAALRGVKLIYELATPYEYVLDLDDIPRGVLEWYGIENDTEVRVETLPWYVSGQHTDELVVDAMFGDDINIVLRARNDMNGELMPNKVYRSVKWRIPRVDSSVISNNGSAVRSDTEEMNFGAILNIGHTTMSSGDPKALEHLRLNWKTADSTVRGSEQERAQGEIDRGWGSDITIKAADLRNGYSASGVKTTSVYPYIYLLGPYEKVVEETSPGVFEDVYDDGELVFDRPID